MESERHSWQKEWIWAIERVGFPIVICIGMCLALGFSVNMQFDFYREQLRDNSVVLRGIQSELVKHGLFMERLLMRQEVRDKEGKD